MPKIYTYVCYNNIDTRGSEIPQLVIGNHYTSFDADNLNNIHLLEKINGIVTFRWRTFFITLSEYRSNILKELTNE